MNNTQLHHLLSEVSRGHGLWALLSLNQEAHHPASLRKACGITLRKRISKLPSLEFKARNLCDRIIQGEQADALNEEDKSLIRELDSSMTSKDARWSTRANNLPSFRFTRREDRNALRHSSSRRSFFRSSKMRLYASVTEIKTSEALASDS